MPAQERTDPSPAYHDETACSEHISRMLSRVTDKWSLLIVRVLGRGPLRFNALRREVGQISQKMLAATLRELESNGFVSRTVTPTNPPQVEYALTAFGDEFAIPVQVMADWILRNTDRIETSRTAFAQRRTAG